jgi:hypothetical protein
LIYLFNPYSCGLKYSGFVDLIFFEEIFLLTNFTPSPKSNIPNAIINVLWLDKNVKYSELRMLYKINKLAPLTMPWTSLK